MNISVILIAVVVVFVACLVAWWVWQRAKPQPKTTSNMSASLLATPSNSVNNVQSLASMEINNQQELSMIPPQVAHAFTTISSLPPQQVSAQLIGATGGPTPLFLGKWQNYALFVSNYNPQLTENVKFVQITPPSTLSGPLIMATPATPSSSNSGDPTMILGLVEPGSSTVYSFTLKPGYVTMFGPPNANTASINTTIDPKSQQLYTFNTANF